MVVGYFTHNLEDSVVGGTRLAGSQRDLQTGSPQHRVRLEVSSTSEQVGAVEKPQMQEYCHLDRSRDESSRRDEVERSVQT